MRLRFVSLLAVSVVSVVFASAASGQQAPPWSGATRTATRTVTCSFSNPGYSGWCRQTETVPNGKSSAGVCREILTCLNNTLCTKTYCNASGIRGNWKLEKEVPRSRPPATKTASLR
jgi:hypothetical protein